MITVQTGGAIILVADGVVSITTTVMPAGAKVIVTYEPDVTITSTAGELYGDHQNFDEPADVSTGILPVHIEGIDTPPQMSLLSSDQRRLTDAALAALLRRCVDGLTTERGRASHGARQGTCV